MIKAALLAGLVLVGLATVHLMTADSGSDTDTLHSAEFGKFILKFGKNYASLQEAAFRLKVFTENSELIKLHNAKKSSYTLGLNEFADLTFEEFSARFLHPAGSLPPQVDPTESSEVPDYDLPTDWSYFDWRKYGLAVKSVRVQGGLHSSAHMASGALQQAWYILGRKYDVPELSVQEFSDCVPQNPAKNPVQENFLHSMENGLNSEDKYPQVGNEMPCRRDLVGKGEYHAAGFHSSNDGYKGAMKLLWSQPTTGGMTVTKEFQFYKSGIWNPPNCPTNVNHVVNIVGFDYDTGLSLEHSFFMVKNCWGKTWGENGFFNIAMSKKTEGVCGITTPAYLLAPRIPKN
jgi:hypothetical protein